jgi:hypothetical protein
MAREFARDAEADRGRVRAHRFAREIAYRRREIGGQLAVGISAVNMLVIPYLVFVQLLFGRLAIAPAIASSLIVTGLGVCGSIGSPRGA